MASAIDKTSANCAGTLSKEPHPPSTCMLTACTKTITMAATGAAVKGIVVGTFVGAIVSTVGLLDGLMVG